MPLRKTEGVSVDRIQGPYHCSVWTLLRLTASSFGLTGDM